MPSITVLIHGHKRRILRQTVVFLTILLSVASLTTLVIPSIALAGTDTYPSIWAPPVPQDSVFDTWREYNRECTSYVAWMLHSVNGYEMPFYGNAVDWKSKAQALGITVDMIPKVGSVYWSPSPAGVGHVAYVEAVGSGGATVTTEDYNSDFTGHWAEHAGVAASSAGGYIHFKDIVQHGTTTIGQFNPSNANFYLSNSNTSGYLDDQFQYGGGTSKPVTGDWNGDGITTIGAVDPSTQTFYLRNANNSGSADAGTPQFGAGGWTPIAGDWDGIVGAGIGQYDPTTSTFYLRNNPNSGTLDDSFQYGAAGDIPVAGDWNGDGIVTIGVFDPTTATFYLRNSNNSGSADAGIFQYGGGGWKPIAGDWNADGIDTIGVVDPSTQIFYLRNSNSSGSADAGIVQFGGGGFLPIAGDWDGL